MDDLSVVYYWLRFGVVVVVAILATVFAVRRKRVKASGGDLVLGFTGTAIALAVAFYAGLPLDPIITAALVIAGVAVGWFGGGARALVGWLAALTFVFCAIMLLFGEANAAALGVSVLAFGLAMPTGQGVRAKMRARGSGSAAAA